MKNCVIGIMSTLSCNVRHAVRSLQMHFLVPIGRMILALVRLSMRYMYDRCARCTFCTKVLFWISDSEICQSFAFRVGSAGVSPKLAPTKGLSL